MFSYGGGRLKKRLKVRNIAFIYLGGSIIDAVMCFVTVS